MDKLGINPFVILYQVVNFFILLIVLKKFLYKPLLAMLDKRRADVEKTLQLKQDLEKQKENADKEKAAAVQEGRKEADRIVKDAQTKGEAVAKQLEEKAKTQSEDIVTRGQEQLKMQEQEIRSKMSGEVSKTALEAAQAVLQDSLTDAQKKKVLEESVKRFASHA